MKNKKSDQHLTQEERRKEKRRPILETFSFFIVIPSKGLHRLKLNDLSESGIGFLYDLEGEPTEESLLNKSDNLSIRFYLNPSLYISLQIEVIRIEKIDGICSIGALFTHLQSAHYQTFLGFLKFLDGVIEHLEVDQA